MAPAWLRLAFASCLVALPSCSSDSAPEPAPQFDQQGSFVAVDNGGGKLTLLRILAPFVTQVGTYLFETVYAVEPASYDEAREMAKNPDLPIQVPETVEKRDALASRPHEVVWFRTLTAEEENRVP